MGIYLAEITPIQVIGVLAILAFGLSTLAFVPYIRDTVAGRTQPQRASWLIWTTLSFIALATQVSEGATSSLLFIGSQFACTACISVLSIRYGSGSFFSHRNLVFLGVAGVGLVIWFVLESAAHALTIVIALSAVGGYATVSKAYREPESETLKTWVMLVAASILGVASVGVLDWLYLAYPVYLMCLYGAIVVAVLVGRKHARQAWVAGFDTVDVGVAGSNDVVSS